MDVRLVEWGTDRVSVSITHDDEQHCVEFAASEDIGREADFLLPATLLASMRKGARLKLPGEISPRLLSAVSRIQAWFRLWDDTEFQRVPVDVGTRVVDARRASGVACFFSGGVDSFYTLLKHNSDVTHLILVHRFDGPLVEDPVRRAQASRMAREVAEKLGKSLIEVETNLRTFPWLGRFEKYHGAMLASVGLLFQHRFRKVLIPASFTYARLVPWGSHPVLDPLWSTELTDFEHDGCEATRPEKTAYVSEHEIAMEWLRVCNSNPGDVYNCTRCEKCLRTMINLQAVGALERCKTFPDALDLGAVANMNLSHHTRRSLALQNLKALARLGTEPELVDALTEALNKSAGADETRPEGAKHDRLQGQLSRTLELLERTRARLARQRAKNKRLTQRNLKLVTRYSGRTYRFVDLLAKLFLRVPGARKLLRKAAPPADRTPG